LISGFVVCNKNKVVITKFLKLTVIFAFVVVAIVLILALIAKPSADLTNVLNGSKTDANLSL
jgi:Tfp pilus assembly protein PilE